MNKLLKYGTISSQRLLFLLNYIDKCERFYLMMNKNNDCTNIGTGILTYIRYNNSTTFHSVLYNSGLLIGARTSYALSGDILLIDSVINFYNGLDPVHIKDLDDKDYVFNTMVLYPEYIQIIIGAIVEIHKKYNLNFRFNSTVLLNYLGVRK